MSNTRTTRKITGRLAAIGAIGALALGAAAVPAFAAAPPSAGGNVSAAIVVPSTLTFQFTGSTSFTLAPGATDAAAVAYVVATNDTAGYALDESGANLTGPGSATLPAADLSMTLHYPQAGGGVNPPMALSTTPVGVAGGGPTNGDNYTEDWTAATLPASTPSGSYGTTIVYLAVGQ